MKFHHFNLFFILTFGIPTSSSNINSQIQGCSLAGIDLEYCLNPTSQTQMSLDFCCTTLNQAVQAGYRCLCTLLGPSNYPFFSSAIAPSFANCFISVPPLTHCQVLKPYPMITPPLPPDDYRPPPPPSPVQGVVMPPKVPTDDLFATLPPKLVNEIPVNSTCDNSTIVGGKLRPVPRLSRHKRWNHMYSDGTSAKTLRIHPRIVLIVVAIYAYFAA